MARSTRDAIQSVAHYVATELGEPWEIRLAEVQEAFKRPFGMVGASAPARPLQRTKAQTDMALPLTVHLWPEVGSDPEVASMAALDVEQQLSDLFLIGSGEGRPSRVPLWNFDDLGLSQEPTGDNRAYCDYLRVIDFSANRVRDPEDPNYWEVVADLRVGWSRRALVPSGRELESVRSRPDPS